MWDKNLIKRKVTELKKNPRNLRTIIGNHRKKHSLINQYNAEIEKYIKGEKKNIELIEKNFFSRFNTVQGLNSELNFDNNSIEYGILKELFKNFKSKKNLSQSIKKLLKVNEKELNNFIKLNKKSNKNFDEITEIELYLNLNFESCTKCLKAILKKYNDGEEFLNNKNIADEIRYLSSRLVDNQKQLKEIYKNVKDEKEKRLVDLKKYALSCSNNKKATGISNLAMEIYASCNSSIEEKFVEDIDRKMLTTSLISIFIRCFGLDNFNKILEIDCKNFSSKIDEKVEKRDAEFFNSYKANRDDINKVDKLGIKPLENCGEKIYNGLSKKIENTSDSVIEYMNTRILKSKEKIDSLKNSK